MRKKAPALLLSTRQAIGRYKKKNPQATINEIASKYNCTVQQARKAINDFQKGLLNRTSSKKKENVIDEALMERPVDELLEEQYHETIALMHSHKEITVDVKVAMLKEVFGMRKILQSLRLEAHLKRADSAIIGIIIRRFMPEATDDDIIAIYNEALAIYRSQQ